MDNTEIAVVFSQLADLLEVTGANPFRVRAYRSASRRLKELGEPVQAILEDPDRKLTDLEGIGKDLAEKIEELVETGGLEMLDQLLCEIPPGLPALLRIPGLGPKKVAAVWQHLGVGSINQLKVACESGELRTLKGFSAKTEESILHGIEIADQAERRIMLAAAETQTAPILAHMRECDAVVRIEPAGSYRRRRDTVGDLDILVDATDAKSVMDHFARYEPIKEVLVRGETKMSVRIAHNFQVDLRVVPADSFGAALLYFTGSKDHNVILRSRAKQQGLKVNEYGVFDESDKCVAGKTEEDIYASLHLPWIPPELREGRREFDWASTGTLPELITIEDIRGDLHMHTVWTDGTAQIEEMADAAKARGLRYIAITDHSKRVTIVGGMDECRLRSQWERIDKIQEKLDGIRILKGVECDILEGGGMDLSDDCLAEADWVIASVHFGQSQPREQITARVLGAIENPYVCVIAHPTGRLLTSRPPYEIDMDAVLQAAAESGTFMELNADPRRLDLHDVHLAAAKQLGVRIVISSDAHRVLGLDKLRFGIGQARRGGLTAADVVNTQPLDSLLKEIAAAPKR